MAEPGSALVERLERDLDALEGYLSKDVHAYLANELATLAPLDDDRLTSLDTVLRAASRWVAATDPLERRAGEAAYLATLEAYRASSG